MSYPISYWVIFLSIVFIVLVLDLGVFNRKNQEISLSKSLYLSLFYFSIGMGFAGWIWYEIGIQKTYLYITGFIIEKTLALDNIFVIALIFKYFAVPSKYQHRVLFWGIIGVIVLRGIMIALGATIVSEFYWVLYIFAVFLIITGIKMLFVIDSMPDIKQNPLLKLLKKKMNVTNEFHGSKFWVKLKHIKDNKKKWHATPLFLALVMVEFVDLIFAVDSVPAIFLITTDVFIVYTSNIFAILGLRALYFALNGVIEKFKYVKYSLAIVLIFIGSKIFIADFMGIEKIPVEISLSITIGLIISGIIYSIYKTRRIL